MMNKKKVLILDLGREYGGAEKVIENLVVSLSEEVEIKLYVNKVTKDKFTNKGLPKHIQGKDISFIGYFKLIKDIFEDIKNSKIDILNTHGMSANLIGVILRTITKVKFIVTIHSDLNYDFNGIKNRVYFWLEKVSVKLADTVVTVSNNLNKKIYIRHNVKPITIYNGVSNYLYNNNVVKEEGFNILFVGRLTKVKNIELLLTGLKFLSENNIQFKCNILGDGEEKEKLIKLAQEYGISNNVNFIGFINDVESYMLKSDILIITSHMEGIPMVIIEAFKYKLPVIASDVGGISEMIINEQTGILFNKDDENEFKKCLLRVSKYSKEKLNILANNAYTIYEKKWNVEVMKNSYLKIFK